MYFIHLLCGILIFLQNTEISGLGNTIIHGGGASFANHFCITSQPSGIASCFGSNMPAGGAGSLLGDNTQTNRNVPTSVHLVGLGVLSSCVGNAVSCFLLNDHSVMCTGSNSNGSLGTGNFIDAYEPVNVFGIASTVKQLVCGSDYVCVLLSGVLDGALQCWGNDFYGQLGNSLNVNSPSPVDVINFNTSNSATWIASGHANTCLISYANNGVFCTGSGDSGVLGTCLGPNSNIMVQIPGLISGYQTVAVGLDHACALATSGTDIKCWGRQYCGILGNGIDAPTCNTVVSVSVLPANYVATQIVAGYIHTCALLDFNQAYCFGNDVYGQMGQGSTNSHRLVGVPVGPPGIVEIAFGMKTTCLGLSNKTVICSGHGQEGQLGNSAFLNRAVFVSVSDLPSTSTPTNLPTGFPTQLPTRSPTNIPTYLPSRTPTHTPTHIPTHIPTLLPTVFPASSSCAISINAINLIFIVLVYILFLLL
jgi:alpha-tubulin suppressor-like RCC1 family protein